MNTNSISRKPSQGVPYIWITMKNATPMLPEEGRFEEEDATWPSSSEGRQFFFLRTACACSCDHCCCDKSELCYWLQVPGTLIPSDWLDWNFVQGDPSGWLLTFPDIKTKVLSQYKLLIQPAVIGWPTGNGKKLSNCQAFCLLPGPAVPGSCLVSFHFLWAILCPLAVLKHNFQCDVNKS